MTAQQQKNFWTFVYNQTPLTIVLLLGLVWANKELDKRDMKIDNLEKEVRELNKQLLASKTTYNYKP